MEGTPLPAAAELTRKIRDAFAPCCLGPRPTPLDRAEVLAAALGFDALEVKREDLTAPGYGGNKVRGLEFLLAGAARGTVFVTVGAAGSSHCLATAVHGRALGHRAALAQFPQPASPAAAAVADASLRAADIVVRAPARALLPLAVLEAWRRAGRLGPRRWIPGGGAAPRAVLGHVLAGLELAEQAAAPPDAIVTPLGSGGTAAGLLVAMRLLAWPTRIVAARVAPVIVANRWRVGALARGAERVLRGAGISCGRGAAPLTIESVIGRGYGWPSARAESVRRDAEARGLVLDSTYGAKAFSILPVVVRAGFRRVVFWHTFAAPPPPSAEFTG